jgi:peptidoglycan DL-endopeptidase CwlO
MAQVDALGTSLETAIAQYQYATYRLQGIQRDLRENRHELRIAKRNLSTSEHIISRRLVTLYTNEPTSTIEVILGARSLDDMINRLDTEKSVTKLDSSVLREVKLSRAAIGVGGKRLARARELQRRIVAQRAAKKLEIESKIAEQRRLLSSIQGQIAQLQAAERQRQLQLEQQAAARLAQQRAEQLAQQDNTIVGVTASAPGQDTVVAPPSKYAGVVSVAMQELGTPYVWGGSAPGGFDCSGLVMWAYAQLGVALPHSSYAMWGYGVPVSVDQLEPGDLVFFDGLGHVGLYIGGGEFIEAPHTGGVVQISSLAARMGDFVGARRIL